MTLAEIEARHDKTRNASGRFPQSGKYIEDLDAVMADRDQLIKWLRELLPFAKYGALQTDAKETLKTITEIEGGN